MLLVVVQHVAFQETKFVPEETEGGKMEERVWESLRSSDDNDGTAVGVKRCFHVTSTEAIPK